MTKQELIRELKIARAALATKGEETRVARATCGTLEMKVTSLTDQIQRMKDINWPVAALERYKVLYERANNEIVSLQVLNMKLQREKRLLSKKVSARTWRKGNSKC